METLPTSVSTSEPRRRSALLDLWRGAAVICMVIWHFLWDLEDLGLLERGTGASMPWELLRAAAVHSFLFLAGISCCLSRNNYRRAGKLALCALLVSIAMGLIGEPVLFGILHLLCVCVLLWVLLEKQLRRCPAWPSAALCLGIFAWLFPWLPKVRVEIGWLWWLGLRTREFYSADYYPLLPWSMLFFAGAFCGEKLCAALPKTELPPALTWVGHHALGIYLFHQPLMMGALLLWQRFLQ